MAATLLHFAVCGAACVEPQGGTQIQQDFESSRPVRDARFPKRSVRVGLCGDSTLTISRLSPALPPYAAV